MPQAAHIAGTVTDTNGDVIPGADIVLKSESQQSRTLLSSDTGFFQIDDLVPEKIYHLTVSAKGFVDWSSGPIEVSPGQFDIVTDIKLRILGEATSVTVVSSSREVAIQQVRLEEQQRVFGFIPNFYVSYDKDAVALTPPLKFRLAIKLSVDPLTIAGTTLLAFTNQAARYPDYQEGAKGLGQRFGALYANNFTDIIVGSAILPSILHQDPRYFYQGSGSKKSRLVHAISNPIICKGDNGRWQPNYSSLGGYLASGSIANAYYPSADRGPGLLVNTFALDFSANVINSILQEFVLRRFTPSVTKRQSFAQ